MVMKIRKATIADAKTILHVLNATPELKPETTEGYTLDWLKGCIAARRRYEVLVAEDKKVIAGFLIANIEREEQSATLYALYVAPPYRKRGIAQRLYKTFEAQCKKYRMKTLTALVLIKNKRMQKWCKKHGYKRGKKFYFYEKVLR